MIECSQFAGISLLRYQVYGYTYRCGPTSHRACAEVVKLGRLNITTIFIPIHFSDGCVWIVNFAPLTVRTSVEKDSRAAEYSTVSGNISHQAARQRYPE